MRHKPLTPGAVVGLIAALVETPILADCVPLRAFGGSPAAEELLAVLRDEWTDGDGPHFAAALDAHLTRTQRWTTRETVRRARAATDAWPALLDAGRALLTRYGQAAGYVDAPIAVPTPDPYAAWLDAQPTARTAA